MTRNPIVLLFDNMPCDDTHSHGNEWNQTSYFVRFVCSDVTDATEIAEAADERYGIKGLPTVHYCPLTMASGMPKKSNADLCGACRIGTARAFGCPLCRLPKYADIHDFDRVWFSPGHERKPSSNLGDTSYF